MINGFLEEIIPIFQCSSRSSINFKPSPKIAKLVGLCLRPHLMAFQRPLRDFHVVKNINALYGLLPSKV